VPDPNAIFGPFDCGLGMVHADPSRIRRRVRQLMGSTKDINECIRRWKEGDGEVASMAAETMLAAVVMAFELTPFDRATCRGLREPQIMDIWNAWCRFETEKKTPGNGYPTGSPPTASGRPATPQPTPPRPPQPVSASN